MKTLLNKLAKATAVLGVAVSSFFPSKTFAKDLWVPSQYSKVKDAIIAAGNGDKIILQNGTYYEHDLHWDASQKHLTIKSASGNPEKCIINAGGEGRIFLFNEHQNENDIIDGVGMTNGKAFRKRIPNSTDTTGGGAILIESSSPKIQNCILENNLAYNGGYDLNWLADGGAIDITSSSSPIIYKNIIRNNVATHGGGGIVVRNSSPIIDSCKIINNLAEACFGGGGVAYITNSSGEIKNCLIKGNTAWFYSDGGAGGGIGTMNSNPEINNCTITNNSTIKGGDKGYGGGGMRIGGQPYPIIRGCTLYENKSKENVENIIFPYSDSLDLSYCLIENWDHASDYLTTTYGANFPQANTIIDADPLLDSNGKPKYGSPCVDSGTIISGLTTDIDGNLRPQDGNGDGVARYDIGCYELGQKSAARNWNLYE